MKPSQTLRAARALIEKPENWKYQGQPSGRRALEMLCHAKATDIWNGLRASQFLTIGMGESWNYAGEHTHAEVLAKFDEAIALAESEGN